MLEGAHIYMLLLFVKRENRDINKKIYIYIYIQLESNVMQNYVQVEP